MARIKNPLLSLKAIGKLGNITFRRSRKIDVAEKIPVVPDAKSPGQLAWRPMFLKCVDLWHTLSAAEKQIWESQARARHMTGYAWYLSQCLRPNPGIYLPLQGGTMHGDIDMAKNRILKLPAPSDGQEPFRLSDYVTYVLPYLLREGARVYHNVAWSLPFGVLTIIPFNSESYDTDSIHSNTVNNSRLTCKTAGNYIITLQFRVESMVDRSRTGLFVWLNRLTYILNTQQYSGDTGHAQVSATTIYHLEVDDYIEAQVIQDSGVARQFSSIYDYWPVFAMQRIG